jgi:hypothetical protein
MGRHAIREPTATPRRQLCAVLPEQLVIRFNEEAPHGERDALLEHVIRSFLRERDPDLKAVNDKQVESEIKNVHISATEREALSVAREHARAILEIAEAVARARKGPKAAKTSANSHATKKRSA